MEYGLPIGIIVGVLLVGFLLKQIKLFLILAILAGAGAWVYLLDDDQKAQITESIENSDQVQELKNKALEQYESVADDIKEQVQEQIGDITDDVTNQAMELYESKKEELSK